MNQEQPHTVEFWCRQQAIVCRTISQEQMNAVLWTLGHEVGTITAWTPEKMAIFYETSAEENRQRERKQEDRT